MIMVYKVSGSGPGWGYKAHPELHVVIGIDEPGHMWRTLQDKNGVGIPRFTTQFHIYVHCLGPAADRELGQCG